MLKSKAPKKHAASVTQTTKVRRYTYAQLLDAIDAVILASSDSSQQVALRRPSLPTIKVWAAGGFFDGVNDLSEATNKAMARLSINAKYYAVAGAVKTPAGSRNHSVDGSTERLSKEIGALREQINDIQKSVLGMYGKASGSMDPAVRLAVEQLDATRRHVLLRFDAEIQLMRQPKSQTQFDSASAMDAQRILAKLSNIESKLDALSG